MTVESLRYDAVVELGKRIVDELSLNQRPDTLSAGMAHYVAELIDASGSAVGEESEAKKKECAAAILALWKHRRTLPDGHRPLEEVEPIQRAIESLDPDPSRCRYFWHELRELPPTSADSETAKWLQAARTIDVTARILIRHCLGRAADSVADKSEEWAALAQAAGLEDGPDLPVIRFVTAEAGQPKESEVDDGARRIIEERLARLESFLEIVDSLRSDLRQMLDGLGGKPEASS